MILTSTPKDITRRKPTLKLSNVTKHYGKSRGIFDISLEVYPGEIFGFLGPNGAGKSTTINTILDILRSDSGTVEIFGKPNTHQTAQLLKNVGYLAGDMNTDNSLTGKQYLDFVASIHENIKPETIASLVKRLSCELDKKIKHLSRGNRQKIGLVASLMHDPDLLILDEPTSGLDPLVQDEFNKIINERRKNGKTTFMSSHVLSEVQEICDRVGFIKDGRLIKISPLKQLVNGSVKEVKVEFAKTVPKNSLINLKGSHNVNVSGKDVSFKFNGDINDLLRLLSAHKITSVKITEPDLTEMFMDYYV